MKGFAQARYVMKGFAQDGSTRGFAQEIRGFAQDGAWNRDARRTFPGGPNSDHPPPKLHFAVASPVRPA